MLRIVFLVFLVLLPTTVTAEAFDVTPAAFGKNQFLVLCYHAIPVKGKENDPYTISQREFAQQIEYLKTHGYHFVSLQQILDAHAGKSSLPDQAILLTFDDAYVSYHDFVVPFLTRQHIPSIVAVIGYFVDHPPNKIPEPIMNWQQIREVAKNPYVEVVSHTYNLHRAIQYNPIGNVGPAVNILAYDPVRKRYETETEYIQRLRQDFQEQEKLFVRKLGFKPRALVWPYGRHTTISEAIAKEYGMQATFTLEWGFNDVRTLTSLHRTMVESLPVEDTVENPMRDFIVNIRQPEWQSKIIRAVQVDLDLIYDPHSLSQTDKNLGLLIDRLVRMGVNRVYLQAFADPDGDGNVDSVYFPNRHLPVVADIFSHAAHQIAIRGIEVFAWMPTLAVTFPDKAFNAQNRVLEKRDGSIHQSTSWYHRLSPFSDPARQRMHELYEDLASHAQIDGILFQDDAYLNDFEDYHPQALRAYREHFGADFQPHNDNENHQLALLWAHFKSQAITSFIEDLKTAVRKYRPDARFARNLYASVLSNPESEAWFAQNFEDYVKHYDEIVVMAYPEMEEQPNSLPWLESLVEKVHAYPGAINKTVFKLQTFDWKQNQWVTSQKTLERMRTILAAGGIHLAYYPDNVFKNQPEERQIRLEMSMDLIPRMKK
ncbi:MAG: poly-beta-1,6-N-acetyl-D-glucosamine N-deacetylase PgaB [Zetaproteobacteria bacterium]|nr:MAG: poly-beta-1,6-N-acetyl-D-glucosamine N-deacetylase PgaB [Zetaproteobacteria bacterium]